MKGKCSSCKVGESSLKYDPNIVKIVYVVEQNTYFEYNCIKRKVGIKYIKIVSG